MGFGVGPLMDYDTLLIVLVFSVCFFRGSAFSILNAKCAVDSGFAKGLKFGVWGLSWVA